MTVERDVGAGELQGVQDNSLDRLAPTPGTGDVAQFMHGLHPRPGEAEGRGD